ncbi:DGQHR domain-containing protein [Delftia lacustris]|uniref:DGQHR domain-containing protein n=1 Tax=Delftia lacustris TaxID=558537 RepID=UPI001FCABFDF|nr:DGQHR domain-containing protein [Delftia lacustris]BDE72774.1 DGQHR domain-containing protein [Delftia lacustris]
MATKKKLTIPCIPIKQGGKTLYMFTADAKKLWRILQINQRDSDKDTGYQRVLSPSRLRSITRFISSGNPVPTSILVSLSSETKVSADGRELNIPDVPDAGWVIDGQHRLAGANEANKDIELAVVAFVGLDEDAQIEQFVTINREAKGVPTSLYLDLLKRLPQKTSAEQVRERAADLAVQIKSDENSPFYARIVITTSPAKGEISLNNFVRKVSPLIGDGKPLKDFTGTEQAQIINNYFAGLKVAFPEKFGKTSIFFQTLGFGALMNALPTALNLCIKNYKAFKVADVAKLFGQISHFNFDSWAAMGTGTAAENEAGEDLKTELRNAFDGNDGKGNQALDLGV